MGDSYNHSLYLFKLFNSSYPDEHFGGKQLIEGSISLAPLYPRMTNDLHIRFAANHHQSFPWLCSSQALFTIFRVITDMLILEPLTSGRSVACATYPGTHYHCASKVTRP